jgi:hypothetical protein
MDSDPEIDIGYVSGKHLSPQKRRFLVGMHTGGSTAREISAKTKIPLQTIRDTIKLDPLRDNGVSIPGRGMPITYDHVFERNLVRFVRQFPKMSL